MYGPGLRLFGLKLSFEKPLMNTENSWAELFSPSERPQVNIQSDLLCWTVYSKKYGFILNIVRMIMGLGSAALIDD